MPLPRPALREVDLARARDSHLAPRRLDRRVLLWPSDGIIPGWRTGQGVLDERRRQALRVDRDGRARRGPAARRRLRPLRRVELYDADRFSHTAADTAARGAGPRRARRADRQPDRRRRARRADQRAAAAAERGQRCARDGRVQGDLQAGRREGAPGAVREGPRRAGADRPGRERPDRRSDRRGLAGGCQEDPRRRRTANRPDHRQQARACRRQVRGRRPLPRPCASTAGNPAAGRGRPARRRQATDGDHRVHRRRRRPRRWASSRCSSPARCCFASSTTRRPTTPSPRSSTPTPPDSPAGCCWGEWSAIALGAAMAAGDPKPLQRLRNAIAAVTRTPQGKLARAGRAVAIGLAGAFAFWEPTLALQIVAVLAGAVAIYYAVIELTATLAPEAREGTDRVTAAGSSSQGLSSWRVPGDRGRHDRRRRGCGRLPDHEREASRGQPAGGAGEGLQRLCRALRPSARPGHLPHHAQRDGGGAASQAGSRPTSGCRSSGSSRTGCAGSRSTPTRGSSAPAAPCSPTSRGRTAARSSRRSRPRWGRRRSPRSSG